MVSCNQDIPMHILRRLHSGGISYISINSCACVTRWLLCIPVYYHSDGLLLCIFWKKTICSRSVLCAVCMHGHMCCVNAFECLGACVEAKGRPGMSSHLPAWDMLPHWPSSHKFWEFFQQVPSIVLSQLPQDWLQVCATTSDCLPRCWGLNLGPHAFSESILLTELSPRILSFKKKSCSDVTLSVVRNKPFMDSLCAFCMCTYACVYTCLCVYVCTNVRCLSRWLSTLYFETRFVLEPGNQWLARMTDQQVLGMHTSLSLTELRGHRHR